MELAAASANCRCSRVVYVGNVPFHASEKELRDACDLIGPVLSFHVAADPATGKRRGYAFVEYADDETARSALRNLNGHFLRGRNLRVGLAGRQGRHRRRKSDNHPVGMEDAVHAACLVTGKPLDAVTRYLAAQSTRELRQMMATLEALDSDTATLLKEHLPGLATLMEQTKHLLDMAAAHAAAAKEARDKKRAASSCTTTDEASDNDDHAAKIRKTEHGANSKSAVSAAGVACF
jgi:cleavage stimulation factor subunit 2